MVSVQRGVMMGNGAGEGDFTERVALWRQFRALFLKDLTLQLRAVATNVCQLLTPIIFICFAGIMQLIINNILTHPPHAIPGSNALPIPNNPGQLIACFKNDTTDNPDQCHDNIFNIFVEIPEWRTIISRIPSFDSKTVPHLDITYEELLDILDSDSVVPCHDTLFDLPFYYVGMSDGVDLELGNLTANDTQPEVNRTGFLGGIVPESWYYNFSLDFNITWPSRKSPNDTCEEEEELFMNITDGNISYGNLHVPFFWRVSNRTELNNILVDVVKNYNVLASTSSFGSAQYNRAYSVSPQSQKQYEDVMHFIQHKNFSQVRPHGGVIIDQFNSSEDSVSLTYTMVADKLVLYSSGGYHIPTSNHSNYSNQSNQSSLTNEIHRRNGIINMMSNAIFKHLRGNESGADVVITTYIMPLPSNVMNVTIDVTTILGGILFPFAFSFVMPVFIAMLVKDRYEKHLIMMEQNGLSRWTYWLVKYCFNFIFYAIIAVVVSGFALAFQIRLFTQTNALVLIVTLFLWGHAQVVLGFFFNNFFSRPRTGIIIGYLLVIAGVVVALLLEFLQVFPSDETPFAVYMMYPPFAFYRILFYLSISCFSMHCYGIDALSPTNGLNLVTTAMLYLTGSTLVLIVVSIYLSYVLPGEYGVRKSPFFPLIGLFKMLRYPLLKSGCYKKLRREKRELSAPPDEVDEEEDMDEDVQAEENALREGFPSHAPVVMYQLRKEYPGSLGKPPHVAVHSVSLAIQRNECFGLLGPNGAGKTTLISVLTGLYEPTQGKARIAGYDLQTEIGEIHRHLGVCPQFDIQDANLTAEEHLLFYARLKGVKWSREKAVVERALRQVNLYDARKCKSKALSGGMRRRLSVAMATIGNPDILILDEPTTGLDPASRRQVWEVIETVKEGRSMILTTHAMEEADYLCTRIGIMNFGRLCCLGTQTRLKTRFGTGYELQFHCAPGKARNVESFVEANLPMATHTETYADLCKYKLEKKDLVVSELFQLFDSARTKIGILDWGVKMTTLEDVFLNIVKNNTDRRTPLKRSLCLSWLPCLNTSRKKLTEE